MKGLALLATLIAAAAFPAAAEGPDPAIPADPQLAGAIQTSLGVSWSADYPASQDSLSYGAEQFSSLRMEALLGERGTVFIALDLVAAAGSSVPLAPSLSEPAEPFAVGSGYAAALELERLYYRIESDSFDVEAGLMRLAFGFGQAWSPSDFLATRNPSSPDARPRGSLALAAAVYPGDWKLKGFLAAGKDALDSRGDGALAGLAAELHAPTLSAQTIYALEADVSGPRYATHRLGLSLKVEAGVGLVLDALYTLDGDWLASRDYYDRDWSLLHGLEASLGADYSFLGGDLYLMVQYLYRGGSALEPQDDLDRLYSGNASWSDQAPGDRMILLDPSLPLGELNRRNYGIASLTWRIDDYDTATLSCVVCLDDGSFVPALSIEREPFQGLALGLDCRVPLDARTLSQGGDYGELGPVSSGSRAALSLKAKLKF